ncbi:hypothetical protein GGR53DRAFT_466126 [Hypoxylon sp. FL1150]|nr:hypothetical protein GGR53DRAFT_466126 [Hypoxylon sp. FL1150]
MVSDELPSTLPDAINLILSTGPESLRVDAICIVQDNAEDNQEQISQMRLTHRGAYFTIAASLFLRGWAFQETHLSPQIAKYSRRSPTDETDKLPGIVALAEEYSQAKLVTDLEAKCTNLDVQATLASSHRFRTVTGGHMKLVAHVRGFTWWKLDTDRLGGIRYGERFL